MHKRATVYSTISKTFIPAERIPELIRRLKIQRPRDEELQKAVGIWKAMKCFGWTCQQDNGDIISLRYRGSEWNINAMIFIGIIARFVEPGGHIRIINENNRSYWVYTFDGKMANRHDIYNRYIDFQDKEDLRKLFNEIVVAMLDLGITKTELKRSIKTLFVKKILR